MSIPGEADGRRFTIETLPADLLEVDPHVQRKLNESRVARLANEFHEAALGVFIVSERRALDMPGAPGDVDEIRRYVVLDGQTRLAALRKFTGTEKTKFPVVCQVFTGLSRAEEAEIFIEHNDRGAVRKIDLFRLALVAHHRWAVDLNDLIVRHGFEADSEANPERRFTAISTAQRIIKLEDGMAALDKAFDLIVRSWGHRVNAASQEAVDGLGLLFYRHGAAVDVPGFARKLAVTDTPQTFKANVMALRGAMRIGRTEAAYRYVIQVYNKGRRTQQLEARK